jgi:hypothetical protein
MTVTGTIWKFPLQLQAEQTIHAPENIAALHLAMQNGTLCLWCMVDHNAPMIEHKLMIRGTGNPLGFDPSIEGGVAYVGSVLMNEGAYVWHVFSKTIARRF